MKTTDNTILITGGSSGIGLALAGQLLALGNTVIITGRNAERLDAARQAHPGLHTLVSDVGDPSTIAPLYARLQQDFPALNVLVNNAGEMRKINLQRAGNDPYDIVRELDINLAGPVRMVQQFLPQLLAQKEAAIVNVSSGLAFVAFPISPVYSAAKAGLHAYTQSLRVQLKHTNIKVFELAPPGTNTPLMNNFTKQDMEGGALMDVETLARAAIHGLEKDQLEIRPGMSNMLKIMGRIAPGFMLKMLSKPVDAMLATK